MSGDKNASEPSLPKAEEILAKLETDDKESNFLQRILERTFSNEAAKSESDWIHLKGLQDHYWHKGIWSWFLMFLLSVMVGFQSFLLFKVGVGEWNFEAYNWLIPALLVQNLGQIIALAVIVVKSLFR